MLCCCYTKARQQFAPQSHPCTEGRLTRNLKIHAHEKAHMYTHAFALQGQNSSTFIHFYVTIFIVIKYTFRVIRIYFDINKISDHKITRRRSIHVRQCNVKFLLIG